MPILSSSYKAPIWARSGHLQTIYPSLYRKVPLLTNQRERITTPDNDFLDLDWSKAHSNKRLVIITHGLEGHSRAHYMQGMARTFDRAKWNILAWNFRSCSGEPNTQLRSYHSGSSDELEHVLEHVFTTTHYDEIALVGFSLGGNLMLKLLGDSGVDLDPRIKAAVALSVPCDLASSAKRLEHWSNRIYMKRFMDFLRPKVREKIERFPELIKDHGLDDMKTFAQFDDAYTAPI
ncbi:MAG: YheT family hydrolase, partial [Coraliomargarita sp.]